MSNPITNTLPPSLDSFLMDIAQTSGHANIDYNDISEFAKRATKEDLKTLKNLRRRYLNFINYDEDDPEVCQDIKKCAIEIRNLVRPQ